MSENISADLDKDLEGRKNKALQLKEEIIALMHKENIDSLVAARKIAKAHGMAFEEMERALNLLDLVNFIRGEIEEKKPKAPESKILNPIEIAKKLKDMIEEAKGKGEPERFAVASACAALRIPRTDANTYQYLLQLDSSAQDWVEKGTLPLLSAKALYINTKGLPDPKEIQKAALALLLQEPLTSKGTYAVLQVRKAVAQAKLKNDSSEIETPIENPPPEPESDLDLEGVDTGDLDLAYLKVREKEEGKVIKAYEKKLSFFIKNPTKDAAADRVALRDKIYVINTLKFSSTDYSGIRECEMTLVLREDNPDFYDRMADGMNLGEDEVLVQVKRKASQLRGASRAPINALCEKPDRWGEPGFRFKPELL